ncbi:MAG TPA: ABC transporter permease [Desulfobulbus sp.]|nr:ABC transporter permease [Desulfobulbus sp.]
MSREGVSSIFAVAWKTVIRKLFRNSVLVLAVGLLVALLVFAFLFNDMVQENLEAASKKLGADIVLVPAEAMGMAEEFILESSEKTFYMDRSILDSVRKMPEIDKVTFQVYLRTLESGCCSIVAGQVVAIDPATDFVVKPWLPPSVPALGEGEAYVGSYVWEYLGLISTATLFGHPIKVVGHLEKTGTGLDHGIFMRYADLSQVTETAAGSYSKDKISIVFIKVREGVDVEDLTRKIQSENPTVGIMTSGTIGADIRATLKDILRVFSVTILVSSLLAILLAWSTFSAITNERKREIGILRAIGARRSHIIRMFMAEAAIISCMGGALGIVGGQFLIHYTAGDFDLLNRLGVSMGITTASVLFSLLAMAAGIVVCLLGALVPIVRLARMEPLLAIKEE